jgi:hypothetical protein
MLRNLEYGSMNRRFAQIRKEEILRDQELVPVTQLVSQEALRKMVDNLGFPEFAAARALHMTGGQDFDKAVEYYELHQDDKDFNTLMEVVAPAKHSKDVHAPAKKEVVKEKPKPTAEAKKDYLRKLREDAKKAEVYRGSETTIGFGVRVFAPDDLEELLKLRGSEKWQKAQEEMLAPKERPVGCDV